MYAVAGTRIMDLYRERIDVRSAETRDPATVRHQERIERELRLAALKAERDEVFRLAGAREIGSALAQKMVREIDLIEARYRG